LTTAQGWREFVDAPPVPEPPRLTVVQLERLPSSDRERYDLIRRLHHANLGPFETPAYLEFKRDAMLILGSNVQDGTRLRPSFGLQGEAGTGKSTAAKLIGRDVWREQVRIFSELTAEGQVRVPVTKNEPSMCSPLLLTSRRRRSSSGVRETTTAPSRTGAQSSVTTFRRSYPQCRGRAEGVGVRLGHAQWSGVQHDRGFSGCPWPKLAAAVMGNEAVLTREDLFANPVERSAAVIERQLYGAIVDRAARPHNGLVFDLTFQPLQGLEDFTAERARISVSPQAEVFAFPLGARPRRWKHRNPSPLGYPFGDLAAELCLYYPGDPRALRWEWEDGFVAYVSRVHRHLFYEEYWRRTGSWPVEDAPHGEPEADVHPITTAFMRREEQRWSRLLRSAS
jgi:hypothetical protein